MECHCLLNRGPALPLHFLGVMRPLNTGEVDNTITSTRFIQVNNLVHLGRLCFGKNNNFNCFRMNNPRFSDSFPITFSQFGVVGKPLFVLLEFLFPIVLVYVLNRFGLNKRETTVSIVT